MAPAAPSASVGAMGRQHSARGVDTTTSACASARVLNDGEAARSSSQHQRRPQTRRRAPAPHRPPPPSTAPAPPTPPSAGFRKRGTRRRRPGARHHRTSTRAPGRRATAPAAVGDAYATPFLRQLAGRTWVERVATPERPGRLESVDELSPILSRHTENNVSEDPHAGLDEDQLAAAVAGLAAPSLRPRRAASWSAGDLSMTFNEQRRRWEGGPQVDLSGFGDDVNPRRTSKSADDAKEDAIAQEELQATLLEAEKRRDGELERFWGGSPADAGDDDAAAWLRRGDAARALGALPEEAPAPAPARRKSPAKGAAGRRAPAPAPARRKPAAAPAPAKARTAAPAKARSRGSKKPGT